MPTPRHIAAALSAATAVAFALAGAPTALAGTYTVLDCGESSRIGNWVSTDSEPEHITIGSVCPLAGNNGQEAKGLYAKSNTAASTPAPNGASGTWSVTVPVGLSITAFSGLGFFYHSLEHQWHTELRDASALLTETGEPRSFAGLATNKIEMILRCVVEAPATGCRDGGTEPLGGGELHTPALTIEDPTAPTLTSAAGALFAGGYLHGTLSSTWSASDHLVGVRRAFLAVDGKSTVEAKQSCEENTTLEAHQGYPTGAYLTINPCPEEPSGELQLNTETLSDGKHTVSVMVENTAGNTASSEAHTIAVDNHGPGAPQVLSAEETNPASFTYRIGWSDPAQVDPAPITQTLLRLCAASTGSCTAPQEVHGTSATVQMPSEGPWNVEVQLVDETGKSSPYGTLAVSVPAPPATTTTTSTTQSTSTTQTTTTTAVTHTTTSAPPPAAKLAINGVQSNGVLSVTAAVPAAANGAKVKLSAHIRKDGREVQSCAAEASVHDGKAQIRFRLDKRALGGVSTIRALYDGHSVHAQAARVANSRRHRRILRRGRLARRACHVHRRGA